MIEVVSFYMSNIADEVVKLQSEIVERYLPPGVRFYQVLTHYDHPRSLEHWTRQTDSEVTVFLDIDCIPLAPDAIPELIKSSREGRLSGCAQRASHIENQGHVYAGPFCMAFSPSRWRKLGFPAFYPTARGDTGEELTYRWESERQQVNLMWPSACENPLWTLAEGVEFGPGTTYSGLFYHAFFARDDSHRFTRKCEEVLNLCSR